MFTTNKVLHTRQFSLNFVICILLFIAANIGSLHWRSRYGIKAVLGIIKSADDKRGAGFPFLIWESGGFSHHLYFSLIALIINITIAIFLSFLISLLICIAFKLSKEKKLFSS